MDWDKAKEIYIKQGGANCEECPAYHTCTLWEPIAECCIATIADEEGEEWEGLRKILDELVEAGKRGKATAAHPQIREVAIPLAHAMAEAMPAVFCDMEEDLHE